MASFEELYGALIRRDGIIPFPAAILRYSRELRLTPGEAWLLLNLLAHRWTVQAPYPSLHRLALERAVPRSTLQYYLRGLSDRELVKVVERDRFNGGQTSSEYHLEPLFRRLHELILAEEETGPPANMPAGGANMPAGPTAEQAKFPLPEEGRGDGAQNHVDPSEEDSCEVDRNGIFPEKNVDNFSDAADPGPDPLVGAVGEVLDRLGQPRVPARRVQLRDHLTAFAAERGRAVADVAHRARNAAGSLRPGDPESLFWSTLDLLAPRREKGDEDH